MADEIKLIPLGGKGNKHATVDDSDYEHLMQFKWTAGDRYALRGVNNKTVFLHRYVVEMHGIAIPDGHWVDHINRSTFDCRFSNLRVTNRYQSAHNRKGHKDSKSQYKGCSWDKTSENWVVQINAAAKHYRMGSYTSEHIAAQVYNEAAKRLHGEFAVLNEVPKQFIVNISTIVDIDAIIYRGVKPHNAKKLVEKFIQLPLFAEPKKKKTA